MQVDDFRKHVLYFYDNFAWIYDSSEWIRAHTRNRVVSLSTATRATSVLDVCTGTGELALSFARRGADVTAVDIAPGMLRIGERKRTPRPVRWLNMDATRLDFPAKHFDISTLSLGLHHMPEDTQEAVLREMARVTRHKVILVEPHAPYNKKLHWLWGIVGSAVDQSEYMKQWVRQDLNATCQRAGLKLTHSEVMTFAIHRISVYQPL